MTEKEIALSARAATLHDALVEMIGAVEEQSDEEVQDAVSKASKALKGDCGDEWVREYHALKRRDDVSRQLWEDQEAAIADYKVDLAHSEALHEETRRELEALERAEVEYHDTINRLEARAEAAESRATALGERLAAMTEDRDKALHTLALGLHRDGVQWVVNEIAELGVKIGDQFFFLYKGESYLGGSMWRPVFKREFGEVCHPWQAIKRKSGEERLPDCYIGFLGEDESDWKRLPHECDEECPPQCNFVPPEPRHE